MKNNDESTHPFASPVCYATQASAAYSGMAPREEIVSVLQELLQAERAGAQVAGHTARETAQQCGESDTQLLLATVQRDEAQWCAMLLSALRRLDVIPSQTVGDFYEKAMAMEDTSERLAFLNKGQAWVVRKLEHLIPRIEHEQLRDELADMRRAHIKNISLTEELLVARGKS